MKIKMTVPVTMQIQPDTKSESFSKNDYTMSFFIPFKHQKDAPAPSAEDVQLTDVQPFCAYVRVYESPSNIKVIEENYKILVEDLKTNGLGDDFRTDMMYSAGYSKPWIKKQHNEIWLVSKRQNPAPLPENENVQSTFGMYLKKIVDKLRSKYISISSMTKKIMSKLPFYRPGAEPSSKWPPAFCGSNDCPNFYEVKLNATDYTLRCYPKRYRWVSTTVSGKPLIKVLPSFGPLDLKMMKYEKEYLSSFVRKQNRNRGFLMTNLSRVNFTERLIINPPRQFVYLTRTILSFPIRSIKSSLK